MAFAELELARIEQAVGGLCKRRTNPEIRDELRLEYSIVRHDVIVFEVRPYWRDKSQEMRNEVAKFKYVRARDEWRLLWMRADLKWHSYDPLPACRVLEELVEEVHADPYCCFFG